jgi:DNA-binding MarR family transcriptional regulator
MAARRGSETGLTLAERPNAKTVAILARMQLSEEGAPSRRQADAQLVEDLAGFVKYLIHAHGEDFFKAVGELELSFSQVRMLSLLARELPQASVKDLADRLGLSLPAVSRSVDGLVQRGYVTRAENSADRRMKDVAITGDGRALFARLVELRVAGAADFVATLSARERTRLAGALAPIVAREDVAALIAELKETSR